MPSVDYKKLYEESQEENSMLRDLLQNRMPTGCIAETTYQPVLEENEKLKERVFELEKEFEEVKKERDIFKGLHKITRCKKVGFMNMKASEDFDKLKEENEKLKSLKQSEINEIVKSDEGTMKLYGDLAKLMSDNEKLKNLIKILDQREEVKKLKEENKELKECNDCHTAELMYAD